MLHRTWALGAAAIKRALHMWWLWAIALGKEVFWARIEGPINAWLDQWAVPVIPQALGFVVDAISAFPGLFVIVVALLIVLGLSYSETRPKAGTAPPAQGIQVRYDASIDREHRPSDPMSGRMVAVDARKVRLVTSKDTDKLAVSVTEMRTVHGAWTHVPFGARNMFGLPAYLTLLDRHAEAVGGAEKHYGLVEKDMTQDRLIRLRHGGAVGDFSAEADRAMCLTAEASAPGLGVGRTWFHVWIGHSAALHCEQQDEGHESPPNVRLPRAPASNELRVLGHYFATGTEIRNQGFVGRTTAETLDRWSEAAQQWEADVFAVLDGFSPALAARFRTLNERALPLPTYMQRNVVNADHELRLRCHHAKLNFLEKDVLQVNS